MNFPTTSKYFLDISLHQNCTVYDSEVVDFNLIYASSDYFCVVTTLDLLYPVSSYFIKDCRISGWSDYNGILQIVEQKPFELICYTSTNILHNELNVYHKKRVEKDMPLGTMHQQAL